MAGRDTKDAVYVFGWPSNIGGASTRLSGLLHLLSDDYTLTLVPDDGVNLDEHQEWCCYLESLGVAVERLIDLPKSLQGWALAMCNRSFIEEKRVFEARKRGLKVAWSNDMMWHFEGELDMVFLGAFQKIIYVSDSQRAVLEPGYTLAMGGIPDKIELGAERGLIEPVEGIRLPWVMTGNYVRPDWFPFKDRYSSAGGNSNEIVIGRLSRPDPAKFPTDFPESYESLGLQNARFRVMGWTEELFQKWPDHRFGQAWDLVPPLKESQVSFLHSLDLFIYELGPDLLESWGRTIVEAMLTGVVPLIQAGKGHLEELVVHGETGFVCESREDFGHYARLLERDRDLRRKLSVAARDYAVTQLCDEEEHRRLWRVVFSD